MVAGGPIAGAAADGRWDGLLTILRAPVSATTWLAVIHLLSGLPIGIVTASTVISGFTTGASLLPVFLAGVPVIALTLWLSRLFGRAERARFALLLGVDIPGPPPAPRGRPGWRRLVGAFASASAWRQCCYALLRLPLSAAEWVVVLLSWSLGGALLTLPAYDAALPGGGAHLGGAVLRGAPVEIAAALVGLVLLLAAPQVTRALASADTAVARWLLGPGSRAGLTARIGELETSRARVVDAAEAERRRIERDLHDGAQQRLVALAMDLGRARAKFPADPQTAAAIVDQAHEQAKEALAELRNLVRGVHPPVLADRGLDAALSGLAARSPVPVTVRADLAVRPSASVEAIAYFVVAEALTNVAKHARATRAEVTVASSGALLTVTIGDDGIGGADPAGQGLSGLAARVAAVDGRLLVTSPAGGPTSIEAVLPCGS